MRIAAAHHREGRNVAGHRQEGGASRSEPLYAVEALDEALAGHVASGSAQALGLVLRHGLAFIGAARAAGAKGGYRIALVRDDGAVIVGTENVIDGDAGAAVSPGHLLA